jgi:hypothetical protein
LTDQKVETKIFQLSSVGLFLLATTQNTQKLCLNRVVKSRFGIICLLKKWVFSVLWVFFQNYRSRFFNFCQVISPNPKSESYCNYTILITPTDFARRHRETIIAIHFWDMSTQKSKKAENS